MSVPDQSDVCGSTAHIDYHSVPFPCQDASAYRACRGSGKKSFHRHISCHDLRHQASVASYNGDRNIQIPFPQDILHRLQELCDKRNKPGIQQCSCPSSENIHLVKQLIRSCHGKMHGIPDNLSRFVLQTSPVCLREHLCHTDCPAVLKPVPAVFGEQIPIRFFFIRKHLSWLSVQKNQLVQIPESIGCIDLFQIPHAVGIHADHQASGPAPLVFQARIGSQSGRKRQKLRLFYQALIHSVQRSCDAELQIVSCCQCFAGAEHLPCIAVVDDCVCIGSSGINAYSDHRTLHSAAFVRQHKQ